MTNELKGFDPRTCIFGKMNRMNRLVDNVFRKHLSVHGITSGQTTILFILSKHPDGLNQKTLGDFAMLEKSTVNRNLKRLIDNEWLSKDNFPTIKITRKGIEKVKSILPDWNKAMNDISIILNEEGLNAVDTLYNQLTKK